jgi:hypothetical protein
MAKLCLLLSRLLYAVPRIIFICIVGMFSIIIFIIGYVEQVGCDIDETPVCHEIAYKIADWLEEVMK